MQLFWIKNDDFTDLVAHAKHNHADNRISFWKGKIDLLSKPVKSKHIDSRS